MHGSNSACLVAISLAWLWNLLRHLHLFLLDTQLPHILSIQSVRCCAAVYFATVVLLQCFWGFPVVSDVTWHTRQHRCRKNVQGYKSDFVRAYSVQDYILIHTCKTHEQGLGCKNGGIDQFQTWGLTEESDICWVVSSMCWTSFSVLERVISAVCFVAIWTSLGNILIHGCVSCCTCSKMQVCFGAQHVVYNMACARVRGWEAHVFKYLSIHTGKHVTRVSLHQCHLTRSQTRMQCLTAGHASPIALIGMLLIRNRSCSPLCRLACVACISCVPHGD